MAGEASLYVDLKHRRNALCNYVAWDWSKSFA
jgi:hypothetical protein